MPVGRYFAYIGSLLLALLFLVDWHMPQSVVAGSAGDDIDRTTIRIHSRHKWPSAVVFDTTQPTIVPPAATAAEYPPAKTPLEAFALAPKPVPVAMAPAAAPKRIVRRARVARAPAPRIASYDTIGFHSPFAPGW